MQQQGKELVDLAVFSAGIIANIVGFFFSCAYRVNYVALSVTFIDLMLNIFCFIKFLISKKRIYRSIALLSATCVLFPVVTLTTQKLVYILFFQYLLPVLYSVDIFKSKKVQTLICLINFGVLFVIDCFRMCSFYADDVWFAISCLAPFLVTFIGTELIQAAQSIFLDNSLRKTGILLKKWHSIALTDERTQLSNKAGLLEKIQYDKQCYAIMIDLDFFKQVNDTWGHLTGDEILANLAKVFKHFNSDDFLVSRYGGEEFLLVSYLNEKETSIQLEQLQQYVKSKVVKPDGNSITLSVGVSDFDYYTDELVQKADDAMYVAKNTGRNRIVWFDEK